MPKYFWNKAVNTIFYILSHCPNVPSVGTIAYEKNSRVKPNFRHIMILRCNAHVHLTKENRLGKFESKSLVCILVDYDIVSKAHKFLKPINHYQ